jgi:prepilin-type processing-associated H-X9-DG protein
MQAPPPPPGDSTPPPPPYNMPLPPYQTPPKGGVPIWVWILLGVGGCAVFGIAILAAILFPVFAQAREKARQAQCASNMKQMSLGVLMYTQDWDEKLPVGERWMTDISPYIKRETVFNCPTLNPLGQYASGSSENSETSGNVVYSYAFNSELSRLSVGKILEPMRSVEIFESDKKTKDAADPLESIANPPRHSQGNNFGYVDGHFKWSRADTAPTGGHSLTIDKSIPD